MQKDREVRFDRDLYHFLEMAVEIWPTFQTGVKHLQEIGYPKPDSYLPNKQYNCMTAQLFEKTIVDDLFDFIMTHDVSSDDLFDYLDDILDLLMMEEELVGGSSNPASIDYMASFTHAVIQELQNGSREKLDHFEINVYRNVKQFKGEIIEDRGNDEGESEGSEEGSQSDDDMQEEIEEPKVTNEKSEEQLQRERELQDDGWVIVKKK